MYVTYFTQYDITPIIRITFTFLLIDIYTYDHCITSEKQSIERKLGFSKIYRQKTFCYTSIGDGTAYEKLLIIWNLH